MGNTCAETWITHSGIYDYPRKEDDHMPWMEVNTPLPFIPSHQGRGNMTFYEFINVRTHKIG